MRLKGENVRELELFGGSRSSSCGGIDEVEARKCLSCGMIILKKNSICHPQDKSQCLPLRRSTGWQADTAIITVYLPLDIVKDSPEISPRNDSEGRLVAARTARMPWRAGVVSKCSSIMHLSVTRGVVSMRVLTNWTAAGQIKAIWAMSRGCSSLKKLKKDRM